ncbi:class I SAM-dependent methyltransferase [Butyrivibrio sp. MC2021]|uniref:class I SAM-dependent methyltransferase n=1 Tax=Butyrivibrio sp. MC2021 TaxID=1408306 RepID=UPI00068752F6|nr:class I SAM-dependent methyltransferase [Butyrivibrio sp. MC2021]
MNIEVKMSQRLLAIAEMLNGDYQVGTVADVGCDHGYVSIYLVQKGIAERAIAMDVRKGPLSGALSNIQENGLEDRITIRLSDGLKELGEGEADALVIAGMGGNLMIRILEEGDIHRLGLKRAILQPQSELSQFRQYLRGKGYSIVREKVILDEGKYYFPMEVDFTGKSARFLNEAVASLTEKTGCEESSAVSLCNRFGESNILRRDPLLKDFLIHGIEVNASILKSLSDSEHRDRYLELQEENKENDILLFYLTK